MGESVTPDRPRSPILELLRLAGPTVAQMASYTVMQFIDIWMLSRVGDAAATAASNAGMFAFAAISLGFGVLMLVNTLVSQSFGQGRLDACGRYLWQGVWFSLGYSVVLLPVIPLLGWAFAQFGHSPALLGMEMVYLRIVLAGSIFKLLSTTLGQFLLAVNRPAMLILAAVLGVSANAFAAWVMMFGKFGVAPMGVAGAAWGQNIGVTVEMLVLIYFVARPEMRRCFGLGQWRLRAHELWTLLRLGVPSGVQTVSDVLAWSLFTALIMGAFGANAMAANTYTFRYMFVSFMPAFGLSAAVTALVGRYIGRGEPDVAAHRAHLGFRVTGAYMLICGLVFFVARYSLIGVFTDDPAVRSLGATMLVFAAVYQVFDAMYITYLGALRGAGDTFVPAVYTATLNWGFNVGGGLLLVRFRPEWGPAGVWTIATLYGIALGLFVYVRFRRGRWRSIRVDDGPTSNPPAKSDRVLPFVTGN